MGLNVLGQWMKVQAVIWREEDMFIIREVVTGVTTQGKTIEEAIKNLEKALSLYLEEMLEIAEELKLIEPIGAVNVEIT